MYCAFLTLAPHDIAFNSVDRRVMCSAHVIDLCSKCVVLAAFNAVQDSDLDPDLNGSDSLPSDNDTIASDLISQAREVVGVIRASGLCQDAFNDVIVSGNAKKHFKDVSHWCIVVKQLELLRDVCMRWDSVYHMLSRLCEMHPVCLYPHQVQYLLNS